MAVDDEEEELSTTSTHPSSLPLSSASMAPGTPASWASASRCSSVSSSQRCLERSRVTRSQVSMREPHRGRCERAHQESWKPCLATFTVRAKAQCASIPLLCLPEPLVPFSAMGRHQTTMKKIAVAARRKRLLRS